LTKAAGCDTKAQPPRAGKKGENAMTIARFAIAGSLALVLAAGVAAPVAAQSPQAAAKIAALKANLATSKAALLKYQWVQTTTVSLNGEVKSSKAQQVTHAADGSLVKTDLTPPAAAPGGLRGRIIERKKEELTADMQAAIALVKEYLPPEAARIEAAHAAGGIDVALAPNGVGYTINIANYLKPGDKLSITIEPGPNVITDARVASWLSDPSDPVTANVAMGTLPGNISYPANIQLSVPSKGLVVTVENSDYIRTTP
jgi:hypothetical protein